MTAPATLRQECTRKRGIWRTERGAQRALERSWANGEDVARQLHVYLCPHCGAWHRGHRPGSGRPRPHDADGLADAMAELLYGVAPFMARWSRQPRLGWGLGYLGQDRFGRWGAMLQGPSRSRQVRSNGNCRTAAAAIRDLAAKARGSRHWTGPRP